MNMIPCPKCGKIIDGDQAFCAYCGTPLSHTAEPEPEPQYTAPRPEPQPEPQYTAPEYSAPRYSAPQPQYYAAQPQYYAPHQSTMGKGWLLFVRVLLWVMCAGVVIASIILSTRFFRFRQTVGYGFLVILGGLIVAFSSVAWGMVMLNHAQNLYYVAENTRKTNELLSELLRKQK